MQIFYNAYIYFIEKFFFFLIFLDCLVLKLIVELSNFNLN